MPGAIRIPRAGDGAPINSAYPAPAPMSHGGRAVAKRSPQPPPVLEVNEETAHGELQVADALEVPEDRSPTPDGPTPTNGSGQAPSEPVAVPAEPIVRSRVVEPETLDSPQVSRHLALELPAEILMHDGDELVVGTIEDLLVEDDRVLTVVAAVPSERGPRRRLVGIEELSWRSEANSPRDLSTGLESSTPDRTAILDLHSLFDGQELSRIEGSLMDRTELDAQTSIFRVHDERNLVHRVLVEPGVLVARASAGLEDGAAVMVEGVETRDGGGKLLVASAFGHAQRMISLRDPEGDILWDRLTGSLLSLRELVDLKDMSSNDGVALNVYGVLLDGISSEVSLLIRFEGLERVVPLSRVASAPDGGFGVLLERQELLELEPPPLD